MKECSKVTVYGPSDLSKKLGIIPFGVKGLSSHDVALFFDNYGIMMRSGYHCAQPLASGFQAGIFSASKLLHLQHKEEIDRFMEILKEFEQL